MFASVSFLLTFPPTSVHGDTVALTIQTGNSPSGVAVNPSTGRIYVANRGDGTISVIDSATKTVVGTITVGDIPAELAINPATNRLYLTYSDNNITTVIDNLERAGLVRRERDAKDRRVIHIHLTEAGSGKVEAVLPGHVAALVEEFSVLSASEQQTLGELCKKLGKRRESE